MTAETPDQGRRPSRDELRLIARLIELSADPRLRRMSLDGLRVCPLDDGGMGSFRILGLGADGHARFGSELAEISFVDVDGVIVVVTLNGDESGMPFEVDVWKTDFSPVVRIPEGI